MFKLTYHLISLLLLTPPLLPAQLAATPQAPQAQTAPCVNPPAPPTQGSVPTFKTPNKWKQMMDQQRQKLEKTTGIPIPDPTKTVEQAVNAKPAPCPPKASVPAPSVPAATSTTAALPWSPKQPDTYVTLHCNPTLLDPTGKRHEASSLLDAETFAVPKANEPEVDRVERDNSSSTPCYRVKINGKNYKYFLQQ